MKNNSSDNFKFDIAISLCHNDVTFARRLVKVLNPTLKVFFYEDKQEEIIGKSGPESFSNVFKDQSRLVVILSRKEWSESFYTEIERNAIIDRIAMKNQGYHFLMVIPMVKNEIPVWYPSTLIYANPFSFSIEQLASFIEFKLTDLGGVVRILTLEDRIQNIKERIKEKKTIVDLQHVETAIQAARNELMVLKSEFNSKCELLEKRGILNHFGELRISDRTNYGYFEFGDFILECSHSSPDDIYARVGTTQDFTLTFELSKVFGNEKAKKSLLKEERLFLYAENRQGWALPFLHEQSTSAETNVLFHDASKTKYYELMDLRDTITIIDSWFQQLIIHATSKIVRYI